MKNKLIAPSMLCFLVCLAGCGPAQSWDSKLTGLQLRVYAKRAIPRGSTLSMDNLVLAPYVGGLSTGDSFTSLEAATGRKNWDAFGPGDLLHEAGLKAVNRADILRSAVVIAALRKVQARNDRISRDDLYATLPELIKDVGDCDVAYKKKVHWAITSIDPEGVHTIPLIQKQLTSSFLVRPTVALLDEFGSSEARALSQKTKRQWSFSE